MWRCLQFVLAAPDGFVYQNGSTFMSFNRCVERRVAVSGLHATLVPLTTEATVGGKVTFEDGSPAAGVRASLYTSDELGRRISWERTVETDAAGVFTIEVPAGCWAVTLRAPDGRTFHRDTRWITHSSCVDVGDDVNGFDAAVVGDSAGDTELSFRFFDHARLGDERNIRVNLYRRDDSSATGSWVWLRQLTPVSGVAEFLVVEGCYTMVAVAPPGRVFTNGTPWFERSHCVDAGEVHSSSTINLAP